MHKPLEVAMIPTSESFSAYLNAFSNKFATISAITKYLGSMVYELQSGQIVG